MMIKLISSLAQQLLYSNDQESLLKYFREEDVIQLKNNSMPKYVISFERLFDREDHIKNKYYNL